MITRINDLPEYVAGFTATGTITKNDYDEVILPAIDELARRTGSIYYLFVIDTDLSKFTPGAWWDDIKLGIQHYTQWKKIAIVTHNKIVEKFSDVFSIAVPGEIRGYQMNKLDEAKQWIATIE